MNFVVLDFQTKCNLTKIKDATVIFYVLGTNKELRYHPNNLNLIGSTRFHDELVKMWSHAQPPQLVRFVLPPSPPSSSSKFLWKKKAKSWMHKSDGNRPQNVADPTTESLLSTNYLKLPEQTHELVDLIRSGLFDETHNSNSSSRSSSSSLSCVSRWREAELKRTVREREVSELEANVKRLFEKSLRSKSNLLDFKCSNYGDQPKNENKLKFE